MSKHLQVLVDERELADLEAAAQSREMSLSEWVRKALGLARSEERGVPAPKKAPADARAKLRWFDAATARQRAREAGRAHEATDSRGWTRDELYARGSAR
jgi:hypothetical protein